MTRRERLAAVLQGKPVDRPPVCFYELNGIDQNPDDPDPFNIYSHPSWKPLIDLTRERTDCIALRGVPMRDAPPDPTAELRTVEHETIDGSRFTTTTIRGGSRTLTSRSRRDPDVNTVWTLEHLLKDVEDLNAWLQLPAAEFGGSPDTRGVLDADAAMGDKGIVAVDTPDPLCCVAPLFAMGDYTVIALTEPALFHQALQKCAEPLWRKTEAVAKALPGRLWRIYGPEYAAPPYLPPRLFHDYVTEYVKPMVDTIQQHGGFARIHSHGRLAPILPEIKSIGCKGLDPVEPPPQGDVSLADVRARMGEDVVLFGNLEISDIENLPAEPMAAKVRTALAEGPNRDGGAFVLMPSACPYGRELAPLTLANYRTIIDIAAAM